MLIFSRIKTNEEGRTYMFVAEIFGGWLLKTNSGDSSADTVTFIPDDKHIIKWEWIKKD